MKAEATDETTSNLLELFKEFRARIAWSAVSTLAVVIGIYVSWNSAFAPRLALVYPSDTTPSNLAVLFGLRLTGALELGFYLGLPLLIIQIIIFIFPELLPRQKTLALLGFGILLIPYYSIPLIAVKLFAPYLVHPVHGIITLLGLNIEISLSLINRALIVLTLLIFYLLHYIFPSSLLKRAGIVKNSNLLRIFAFVIVAVGIFPLWLLLILLFYLPLLLVGIAGWIPKTSSNFIRLLSTSYYSDNTKFESLSKRLFQNNFQATFRRNTNWISISLLKSIRSVKNTKRLVQYLKAGLVTGAAVAIVLWIYTIVKWYQENNSFEPLNVLISTIVSLMTIAWGWLNRKVIEATAIKDTHADEAQNILLKIVSVSSLSEYVPYIPKYAHLHPERIGSRCIYSKVTNSDDIIYAKGVSFILVLQHLSKVPYSAIIRRFSAIVEKYLPVSEVDYVYPEPFCFHPKMIEPTHVQLILTINGQEGSVWIPRDEEGASTSLIGYPLPKDHWEWFPWHKENMTSEDVMYQRLGLGANMVIAGANALGQNRLIQLVPSSHDDVEVLDVDVIGADEGYYEFHIEVDFDLGDLSKTIQSKSFKIFHNPKL